MTETLQIHRLSELSGNDPKRMPTGFKDLDIAYGINRVCDEQGNEILWEVGMPRGRVTILAGAGGVGKSRLCMQIGMQMAKGDQYRSPLTVLYILNEDDPNSLATWVKRAEGDYDFFVVGSDNRESHKEALIKTHADVVFIDSLTGLEGVNSPNVIREIMKDYKDLAIKHDCHIVLISHLNKAGAVKGNSDITYYPDHTCELRHLEAQKEAPDFSTRGMFYWKFTKNRGSADGSTICFKHTADGVDFVISHITGYNDKVR
jgi:predicted ATP-dependent serine protease